MCVSDKDRPKVPNSVSHELDPIRPDCPRCGGSGELFGLGTPIALTAIGIGLTWLGWINIETLVSPDSDARANQLIMFLIVCGPALVVGAWWKCLWSKCDECNGRGRTTDASLEIVVPVEPSPRDLIIEDQECHDCGYNTRTKCVGDACPECGTTILTRQVVKQRIESRQTARFSIIAGISLVVGLIGASILFGVIGAMVFFGIWFSLTVVLKGIAIMTRR